MTDSDDGFVAIPRFVIDDEVLTPLDVRVFAVVVDAIATGGVMSLGDVAERCCASYKGVESSFRRLRERGALRTFTRWGPGGAQLANELEVASSVPFAKGERGHFDTRVDDIAEWLNGVAS